MKAEEVFVYCYKFNPIKSKKVIFKVSYKTTGAKARVGAEKIFSAPQHCFKEVYSNHSVLIVHYVKVSFKTIFS
jgi:hypothetical protein